MCRDSWTHFAQCQLPRNGPTDQIEGLIEEIVDIRTASLNDAASINVSFQPTRETATRVKHIFSFVHVSSQRANKSHVIETESENTLGSIINFHSANVDIYVAAAFGFESTCLLPTVCLLCSHWRSKQSFGSMSAPSVLWNSFGSLNRSAQLNTLSHS